VTIGPTPGEALRDSLRASLPSELVDELLAAHAEAKRSLFLGGLRLAEVEGGRFCEAAYRILEFQTTAAYTPLGKQLDTEKLGKNLAGLPQGSHADSVRIHIPRALRVVYDVRNKRDAAHLGDGIDPNLQDATLVAATIDWVLAELVRLHHAVSPNVAHGMVEHIVTRQTPVVEDFDGFLKVLRTDLGARERCLVLLYQRGKAGASLPELSNWVPPAMRKNLKRTLTQLVHEKAWVHESGGTYRITKAGIAEVDRAQLIAM
jgi:hypothetical protein